MDNLQGEPERFACEELPVTPVGNRGVRLLDLQVHHCRYMISETRFCGERKRNGSSYCADHHKLCWTPQRKR
jgi:hypothetical protein